MLPCKRLWRVIPKSFSSNHWAIAILMAFCTFYPVTYLYFPINYIRKGEIVNDIYSCSSTVVSNLPLCPVLCANLKSYIRVERTVNASKLEILAKDLNIEPGGKRHPSHCCSHQKVAVVVPYRNREENLLQFLQHMHPILHKQNIYYQLFIIEQSEDLSFNRAMLFNIGFKEALKVDDFCCFIFHDVDLLPMTEQHMYLCSENPRHMCVSLDKFRFRLPYAELFGGAIAISRNIFEQINGYSNCYFGWGGEDDDFFRRMKKENIPITRWEPNVSRYTMLVHRSEPPNPNRFNLLKESTKNSNNDGINTTKYSVLRFEMKPLYTRILVRLDPIGR